uniref:RING-type domain-containing protein n=1 Tax=Emiliania huxleyi TaxID=2903 RepID=A0A7S3W4R2_EMIHU
MSDGRLAPSARQLGSLAGSRTWKAWAGRSTGGDSFAVGDLTAGLGLALRRLGRRRLGHRCCPICYDEREDGDDDWHLLWCGCAACGTCMRRWAQTALSDRQGAAVPAVSRSTSFIERLVALTCPVCTAPLRPADAVDVLARDASLLQAFDKLLRDAALRGAPDYRPCPRAGCSGGGFVDWRCVSSVTLARRSRASAVGLLLLAAGVTVGRCAALTDLAAARALALLCAVAPASALLALAAVRCGNAARSLVPLSVECPECGGGFQLPTTDAVADAAAGGGDAAWVRENTRPCPRCAAPILKAGGRKPPTIGDLLFSLDYCCSQGGGVQPHHVRGVQDALLLGVHAARRTPPRA